MVWIGLCDVAALILIAVIVHYGARLSRNLPGMVSAVGAAVARNGPVIVMIVLIVLSAIAALWMLSTMNGEPFYTINHSLQSV